MPTWLITGCSSGFGRALATAVLGRGWNAVVTARDPATVADIVSGHESRALPLRLDVTDQAQVIEATKAAESRFGTIDVLVNNAGYGYRGAVEEADDADVRSLLETNFFGLVAMTKAVLPGMRARRRGHIVNISSIAGRRSQAGSGYYSATKFAVGGLSDALRKELKPLGIGVTVVEPSGFRTDFAGRSLRQSRVPLADYAETAGRRRKERHDNDGKQAGDPARAAAAIIQAVGVPDPPFRLLLGRAAVEGVRTELEFQHKELAAWEAVSLDADHP